MGVGKRHGGELSPEETVALAECEVTPPRKPYQKPAFRYERVFETMALSCGKVSPTQFQCRSMKTS
jgi:hypothetical protein